MKILALLFEDMETYYEIGIISITQMKIWAHLFLHEVKILLYF